MLIKFILFPFMLLSRFALDNGEKESELVEKYLAKYANHSDVHGAIFKVKTIKTPRGNDLLDFCVETISLTDQDSKEKLSYYLRSIR